MSTQRNSLAPPSLLLLPPPLHSTWTCASCGGSFCVFSWDFHAHCYWLKNNKLPKMNHFLPSYIPSPSSYAFGNMRETHNSVLSIPKACIYVISDQLTFFGTFLSHLPAAFSLIIRTKLLQQRSKYSE